MLVVMGIMVAMHIVLARFLSINAWNMRIGFAFLPIFMTAYLYGPFPAATVGLVSDVLGATLFPTGKFFPGFTLNAILSGVIMGIFLYKKQDYKRIGAVTALEQLGISLWLTPLWLSILYGSPYFPLIVSRLPQIGIMLVIEPVLIFFFLKVMERAKIKESFTK